MRNIDHVGIVTRAERPSPWFSQTMSSANFVFSCTHRIQNQTTFDTVFTEPSGTVGARKLGQVHAVDDGHRGGVRVLWGGDDAKMAQAMRSIHATMQLTFVIGKYGPLTTKSADHLTKKLKKDVVFVDPSDDSLPDYIRCIIQPNGTLLLQKSEGEKWVGWCVGVEEETETEPEEAQVVAAPEPTPKPKGVSKRRKKKGRAARNA